MKQYIFKFDIISNIDVRKASDEDISQCIYIMKFHEKYGIYEQDDYMTAKKMLQIWFPEHLI